MVIPFPSRRTERPAHPEYQGLTPDQIAAVVLREVTELSDADRRELSWWLAERRSVGHG